MAQASRDQNNIPTLLGVSNVDGRTPIAVYADPVTHRLLVDATGGGGGSTSIGGAVTGGTTGSVLFVGPGPVLAQDNANFFWDDTNNYLGIGTNTPDTRLHLSIASANNILKLDRPGVNTFTWDMGGGTNNMTSAGLYKYQDVTTDATNKSFRLGTSHYTNAQAPMGVIYANTTSGGNALSIGGGTSAFNAATSIDFFTGATTTTLTGTSRMTILSGGNVGIGTSGPLYPLVINTTNGASQTIFNTESDINSIGEYNEWSNTVVTGDVYSSFRHYIHASSIGGIGFNAYNGTANAEVMRIIGSGNVGIGTSAPSARLHAVSTTEQFRSGYDLSNYMSVTTAPTGSTTFALTGTAPQFFFGQATTITGGLAVTGNITSSANITAGSAGSIGWTSGSSIISPSNGTLRLGNTAATTGVRLDFTAADTLAIRNFANTADGSFTGRYQQRVTTIVSSATPTYNTNASDAVTITALATNITSMTTNISGTAANFQKLIFRIKDDGTPRTISWGASFVDAGVPLPTTTVANKLLTVGFMYDTVTSLWGCVAVANQT